jgi:glutamate synthase (ferredoxin)
MSRSPAVRTRSACSTPGPRRFARVIPKDYKRVLACLQRAHDQGLSGDEAVMAAFEENSRDLARVGGN